VVDKVFRSSKNNLFEYYDKEKSTESTQVVCSILHEVINKICQSPGVSSEFTLSRGHTSGPGAPETHLDCVFPVTSGPYTLLDGSVAGINL